MTAPKLERRVAALEAEVAQLKQKLQEVTNSTPPWWEQIAGTFANEPAFEEAMRLGRKYRESQRPKPTRRKKRSDDRACHRSHELTGMGQCCRPEAAGTPEGITS